MAPDQVGRYRIEGPAQPDRGAVRRPASDTLLGREVWLRTLPQCLQSDPHVRGNFLLQLRHLSRLRHPNIASILDVVEEGGNVWQVLTRETGIHLELMARKSAPVDPGWALGLAADLCDGLAYVHAEEVVHGRIEPSCIWLRADDVPVLYGFEPEYPEFFDPVLRVGTVVGNARYVSPEVARREPRDVRSDLWSLGMLLFHLLTGRFPHVARDAVRAMEEVASPRPFEEVSKYRAGIPAPVCALVARLLDKDPARRPPSVQAVRAEIERALHPEASEVPGGRTIRLLDGGPGGLRRFAIQERIGRGGFGVVFRALERGTGRTVAVKILRPDLCEDARITARMRREAEAVRALDHPNVVKAVDLGCDGGATYLVMEFVRGPSLADVLRRDGRIAWTVAARWGRGILEALAHAHPRGVVHRDLKPANVLLRDEETPVLVDFGMSHVIDATRLTQEGEVLGTPNYMAPEQFLGEAADPRSDLYAVGAILYEAMSGDLPFRGETLPALCRAVVEGKTIPLRERCGDVPESLAACVMRLLSRDPADRGGGAGAVAAELAAFGG